MYAPDREGNVNPAILWAARYCGVTEIYKIGGMQAIAAMVFGTQTVPKVYKIFGPGNQYVTAAKQLALQYGVAIDMPAGPSEVMVVADESSRPGFVAADLLSQAEHGKDSQVILVTCCPEILPDVERELERQLAVLPRREVAVAALQYAKFVVMPDIAGCIQVVNEYAPEHLILCVADYKNTSRIYRMPVLYFWVIILRKVPGTMPPAPIILYRQQLMRRHIAG